MENIKRINPKELIYSKEFVREPVNLLCKEIEKRNLRKMILNGGRGIGKSTVLQQLQNRSIDTEKPFICMQFDAAGLGICENETFSKEFFIHYWEERFANQLLHYIRNYYERTYYNNFREYSTFIKESSRKTVDFINNSIFDGTKHLDRLLSSKEISGEILNKLKSILPVENIGLCIDRFDWTNNNDALTQHILSEYFDLFRNIIITSDDDSLINEWEKRYKDSKSSFSTYKSLDISYGQDITIIKLILLKRIESYNRENFILFPHNWLEVDIIDLLIKETNGNISMILDILNNLVSSWNVKEEITQEMIERAIEDTKGHARQLKQMGKPIKFHL